MALFKPTSFTIDSNLSLPADGFTAEIKRSSDFVNASENDRVTLKAGFEIDGVPYLVTLIKEGVIDNYYLKIGKDVSATISGRDQMSKALDSEIQRRYLVNPPAGALSGESTVEEFVGNYTASQIAADIAGLCGLNLSWQCRDYSIAESFEAVGRPFDILKSLVEPWSQFEPLMVDIFIQGDTIICRSRSVSPTPDDLGTFTVRGSRIYNIQLRKFKTPLIGTVDLTGMKKNMNVVPNEPSLLMVPPPASGTDAMANVSAENAVACATAAAHLASAAQHAAPGTPLALEAAASAKVAHNASVVANQAAIDGDAVAASVAEQEAAQAVVAAASSTSRAASNTSQNARATTRVMSTEAANASIAAAEAAMAAAIVSDAAGAALAAEAAAASAEAVSALEGGNRYKSIGYTTEDISESYFNGRVTGRVITRTTHQDDVVTKEEKSTWVETFIVSGPTGGADVTAVLVLGSTETKECRWEIAEYGPNGEKLNQPLQLEEITTIKTIDPLSPLNELRMIVTSIDKTSFAYDKDRFLSLKTTQHDDISTVVVGGFGHSETQTQVGVLSTVEIQRYKTIGPLWLHTITEKYAKVGDNMFLTDMNTTIGSGQRPGGIISGGQDKPSDQRLVPEIRWNPGRVATGSPIDPALNATAVGPDEAHLVVPGSFIYVPGAGTIAASGLIMATRGAWQATTVYFSGDSVIGDGRVWEITSEGTSGGTEPEWPAVVENETASIADGTVAWSENATNIVIQAIFTPSDPVKYTIATAERSINVMSDGLGPVTPEIRWTPGPVAAGHPIDPALNATAVTPDVAHLEVAGTFSYSPGEGTIAAPGLVIANKGAWQPETIYASGDSVTGGGSIWVCTTPGTSEGAEPVWPIFVEGETTPPVSDFTVVWAENRTNVTIKATFTPGFPAFFKTATAEISIDVTGEDSSLIEPEIRWTPGDTTLGEAIDPALNATAVTPDEAHLAVSGTFSYSPDYGTVIDPGLISASRGAWQATTIYASGDSIFGAGRVWKATTPGTTGGSEPSWPVPVPEETTPPVPDGTVIWEENTTDFIVHATFTPDDTVVYKIVKAEQSINIGSNDGTDLLDPEIRWNPGSVGLGGTLAAACNATAVTPDEAHLPLGGSFSYTPPADSVVSRSLVAPNKTWAAGTIFSSEDTVAAEGRVWTASTPGTTSGSEPAWPLISEVAVDVPDGTVIWTEETGIRIHLLFTPDDPTYRYAEEKQTVSIDDSTGLLSPEIRWEPEDLTLGGVIDPALNAIAVTPDEAHLIVPGTFSYTPGPGTIDSLDLVTASKLWTSNTIYASGDRVAGGTAYFRVSTPGTSGGSEPVWPIVIDGTTTPHVNDGTVTWTEDSGTFTITAVFTPSDPVAWKSITEDRTVNVIGSSSGPGNGTTDNLQLIGVVSTAINAVPFQYSNQNLTLEDLTFIFEQAQYCSGLWQHEEEFQGVNVPWLRRGSVVQFTELKDELDRDITLPPALIQSLQLSYNESSITPSFSRQMKALAWTPSGIDQVYANPTSTDDACVFIDRGDWLENTAYMQFDYVSQQDTRILVALRFAPEIVGRSGPYRTEPLQDARPGLVGTSGWLVEQGSGGPIQSANHDGIQWMFEHTNGGVICMGWFVVDAVVTLTGTVAGQSLHVTRGPVNGYWTYYPRTDTWKITATPPGE